MTQTGLSRPSLVRGLSARLLVLTMFFVMLSEVLIYVPSIARFRQAYLQERISSAYLASLALKATPDYMVSEELKKELLSSAGVHMIALKRPLTRTLMLSKDMPPKVDAMFDLRDAPPTMLIMDAFSALTHGERVLRIVDKIPDADDGHVEIMMDEAPLYEAMLAYSTNILKLSVVISLVTAGLVYLALHILLVRPMRRITQSMLTFRDAPEEESSVITPGERSDEIGVAQRVLAAMQQDLRAALTQKTRLAALGTAVSKINHDLRNILATAQLVSDRLAESEDPEVRRLTPSLIRAIDRAINLCTQTLNFGSTEELPPTYESFAVEALIDDVHVHIELPSDGRIAWRTDIDNGLGLNADREQVFRILLNLGRNAVQAMPQGGEIRIAAQRHDDRVLIDVSDTGGGLPAKAKQHLFQPFAGSARSGGTGLGLVIAQDLARGHGGDVSLIASDDTGTTFRLELPLVTAPRPAG